MNIRARAKILVADDYPGAADVTVDLLRLEGYEAVATYDGAQAVTTAITFKPDLAILDIEMPVMDGLAAARALRQAQAVGARLILIAHTGRGSHSDKRAVLEAGFDLHVKKPLLGQDLCDLIAACLANVPPPAERTPGEPGHGATPPDPATGQVSRIARRPD